MQDVLSDEFSVTTTEPHSVGFLIEQYDDMTLTLRSSQEHGDVTVGQLLNKITVVVKDKSSRLIEDVDVDTLQDAGLGFVVLAQTARFDNDYYKNMMLVLTSGPGVGHQTEIDSYDGTTRRDFVSFLQIPGCTTQYEIQYIVTLRVAFSNGVPYDLRSSDVFTL